MENSHREMNEIYQIINPLLGQRAWNVSLGVGNFVTMNFGELYSVAVNENHGGWLLWIYGYGWYIENPKDRNIGSEDPRDLLRLAVSIFEGRVLERVEISPIAFETNFILDSSLVLHIFPLTFINDPDSWMLFTPERKVLILNSTGEWSYRMTNSKPAEPNLE